MADHTGCLLFFHISEKFFVHNPVKFCFLIYKMNHAKVYIVCLKPCQKIRKGFLYLIHLPGANILTILPCRTEMPLNNPFPAFSFQRVSDIGAHIRL